MKYILIILTIFAIHSCNQSDSSVKSRQDVAQAIEEVAKAAGSDVSELEWLDIDALDQLDMAGKKGVLVDVYTDWCGYCKIMDKHTFTDPEVVAYLSENYHLIKFNAEQKEPVVFDGRTYEWQSGGRKGYNTLARDMLEGQMSYPSMVYYNEDKIKIIAVPGYKKPAQLLNDIERVQKLPM